MSTQNTALDTLLSANAQWAEDVHKDHPAFLHELSKKQTPEVLWIGCADSRVPETVITGAKPGDIFVHRNIANQFHPEDASALSVLAYAVGPVGVKHIIVVGHSQCGGAAACFSACSAEKTKPTTPLAKWLEPLTELARSLHLSTVDPAEALPVLIEENVKVQVENLAKSDTITSAWAEGNDVQIHGWVYDIPSGRLQDLGVSKSAKQSKDV